LEIDMPNSNRNQGSGDSQQGGHQDNRSGNQAGSGNSGGGQQEQGSRDGGKQQGGAQGSTRGGSHEQHVNAGKQSHKNG
jgi:hypothetical protein